MQIQQIYQMLSQLFYKPSVKGSVGEKILAEIWPQYFNKDVINLLGGAGREDFLVTPYLNSGISSYGDRISIERKSGKQTYTGAHFKEAIRQSIEKGATYAIIVYDTQDNLPQKTMFAREKGVLVAVVDIGAVVKYTSDIRGKTAKIQAITEKIDEDLDEIKDAVANYQNKLKTAVVEIENERSETVSMTQQVESGIVRIR